MGTWEPASLGLSDLMSHTSRPLGKGRSPALCAAYGLSQGPKVITVFSRVTPHSTNQGLDVVFGCVFVLWLEGSMNFWFSAFRSVEVSPKFNQGQINVYLLLREHLCTLSYVERFTQPP